MALVCSIYLPEDHGDIGSRSNVHIIAIIDSINFFFETNQLYLSKKVR